MRNIVKATLAASIVSGLGLVGAGCLTRPVVHQDPTTKDNFTTTVRQQAIDKIDLLFDIDNSASMGDKQDFLKQAIPDLIVRLIQPNCVDPADATKVVGQTDAMGNCATGKPEFPPVHNMHIGVVSSALGPRLGDVCNPTEKTGMLLKHNDDQAHLLNRATDAETAEADMQPSNFLSWFPDVAANNGKTPGAGAVPIKDVAKLESDFSDLIAGVHQLGCGIESQLETWYRFLVQPDPYNTLANNGGHAAWVDVDQTIIAQRHDFLRPDSLVAIIVLSDENDSEIDVRAIGQQGFNWMATTFNPPKGTSACDQTPGAPACTSCLLAPNGGAGDPNCAAPYSAQNDWGYNLNLRHVHMKQKYGIDVQFPIGRYVNGLSSSGVPNRDGEYPSGKANYVGNNNCTNPLYAGILPDGTNLDYNEKDGALCKLPLGTRTKDLIFYAHIGGVPHELLHFTPGDSKASTLTDADWVKILGTDPQKYDYTGIDPHMIESYQARPGLPAPSSADSADPIHGREWVTNASANFVDRQFSCTFPLAAPRDCSLPANTDICDCPSAAGVPHDQVPPVCDPADITKQIKAKAYPTIRETLLAHLMGDQGILSSICPINTTDKTSPLYGYRPAVSAIVDRLKNALANQCLPQPLTADDQGNVPCLILEVLPDSTTKCSSIAGLSDPPPAILQKFKDSIKTNGKPGDPSLNTICQIAQLVKGKDFQDSCASAGTMAAGWCYVTGAAAGTCPQAILFSPSGNPQSGSQISLQCIEQFGGSDSGTGGGG